MAPPRRVMPDNLVELYEGGWSARRLAGLIGCAVATVLRHLHERGAKMRGRGAQRKERAS